MWSLLQKLSSAINPLYTRLSNLPTGWAASSSTRQNPNNKRWLSDCNEFDPPGKRNVTDDDIDEGHSIHTDDYNDSFVGDAQDLLAKTETNE